MTTSLGTSNVPGAFMMPWDRCCSWARGLAHLCGTGMRRYTINTQLKCAYMAPCEYEWPLYYKRRSYLQRAMRLQSQPWVKSQIVCLNVDINAHKRVIYAHTHAGCLSRSQDALYRAHSTIESIGAMIMSVQNPAANLADQPAHPGDLW